MMCPNKRCVPVIFYKYICISDTIGCTDEMGKLKGMILVEVPLQTDC